MHLPKRDIIATCLVAAAGLLYLLWAIGSTLPGMSSTRATGVAVLALGFAASARLLPWLSPPAWPRWTPARRNQDGAWGHMAPALQQARRARRRARQHSLGTCGAPR